MELGSQTNLAFSTPWTQAALSGEAKDEFESDRAQAASWDATIRRPPPSRYRFTRSRSAASNGVYCSSPTFQRTPRRALSTVRSGTPWSAIRHKEWVQPFAASPASYDASLSGGNEGPPITTRTS